MGPYREIVLRRGLPPATLAATLPATLDEPRRRAALRAGIAVGCA